MAIEPEFVRLMKRWIRSKTDTKSTNNPMTSSSGGMKPLQLDDDDDDLR
jgi:hypothetical protein